MVRKVYQSIHYQVLDTYIEVNGKRMLIKFRGGSLKPRINGKFITTNPDIITVMDEDAERPGASFRCILSQNLPDSHNETEKVQESAFKVMPEPNIEEPEVEKSKKSNGLRKVYEVKTIKDAREYLVGNVEGFTNSKLPNAIAIKNAAAKNNIVFPNLP